MCASLQGLLLALEALESLPDARKHSQHFSERSTRRLENRMEARGTEREQCIADLSIT